MLETRLNQSVKCKFDYILLAKMFKINTIDKLLHAFYEEMYSIVKNKFYKYIVKLSQVNSSFYVLIRKSRGKILGDGLCRMMKQVKDISEKI